MTKQDLPPLLPRGLTTSRVWRFSGTSEAGEVWPSLEAFASLASSTSRIGALPAESSPASENAGFDLQRAPRLWGSAQALREEIGAPLSLGEQTKQDAKVAETRQRLGEAEWTAAWEQGRQMSLEEVVAYALEGNEAKRENDP